MCASFFGIFKNMPSRFREGIRLKSFITEHVMKITWGALSAKDGINSICGQLGLTGMQPVAERTAMSTLIDVVAELFSDSSPLKPDRPSGKPLGLLAEQLVMRITGEDSIHMMTLLENPLLHAYGNIEQSYLDLLKKSRSLETIERDQ